LDPGDPGHILMTLKNIMLFVIAAMDSLTLHEAEAVFLAEI
jgi:hypothetical protein